MSNRTLKIRSRSTTIVVLDPIFKVQSIPNQVFIMPQCYTKRFGKNLPNGSRNIGYSNSDTIAEDKGNAQTFCLSGPMVKLRIF